MADLRLSLPAVRRLSRDIFDELAETEMNELLLDMFHIPN